MRFLGRAHGNYYPEDPRLGYEVDALADTYLDVVSKIYKPFFEKDEAKKEELCKEIFEKILPTFMGGIEEKCG